MYRQLLVRNDMKVQLKELASNDILKAHFCNLCKVGAICLSLHVTMASVERSISQIKLVKIWLRSSLNDKSLPSLMKNSFGVSS